MRHLWLACAAVAVAPLLLGCGDLGSYEIRWSIGCGSSPKNLDQCEPYDIKGCSLVGLDSVEVVVQDISSTFACFVAEGPVGRGPGLDPGKATMEVYGLSPAGLRITGPVKVPVDIPETGLTKVRADLPVPVQCLDGVDNDSDGLVDMLDTGCSDTKDTDESS